MVDNVKSAKEKIRYYMKVRIPCYLEGPPGVGKSEAVEQVAAEENINFIDTRLAQLDPVDLRGLPNIHKGITTWARPDFLPTVERDGERGIWLLDELGDCGKAMQSAAYQPILNHRVGPHLIPPNWYVVGAGNNQSHRAGAQPMSTALASRFGWITIEADWECFREHGARHGLHPWIIGFTKFRTNMLHNMEGANGKTFPCPRTWFYASKCCDAPKSQRYGLITGCVGEAAAGELEAYLRTIDLPSFEDVIAAPKKCHIPQEPSHKYALTTMLSQHVDRNTFDKVMQYVTRTEFGRDFEICCILDAAKTKSHLTEHPVFTDWANRHQDVTINAEEHSQMCMHCKKKPFIWWICHGNDGLQLCTDCYLKHCAEMRRLKEERK